MTSAPLDSQPTFHGRASLIRAVVVPLAVMVASVGLTTLWVWSLRDRLLDKVAVHWGPKGTADRWDTLNSALLGNALIAVLIVVALVLLAAAVRERVALPAVASGMAVFLSVGTNAMIAKQTRDNAAPTLGYELLIGLLAGGAVGAAVAVVLLRLLRREPQPVAGHVALPPGAPVLHVPDTMPVSWAGETRTGVTMWVLPFIGIVPVAGFMVYMAAGHQWGIVSFLLVLLIVLCGLFLMVRCHVTVDERGLRATAGRITWLKVPLEQMESAEVDHVEPLGDFGGWGIRFGMRGLGLVTSRGEAVWIARAKNSRVCVTVTDPEGCAAAINTLIQRRV